MFLPVLGRQGAGEGGLGAHEGTLVINGVDRIISDPSFEHQIWESEPTGTRFRPRVEP